MERGQEHDQLSDLYRHPSESHITSHLGHSGGHDSIAKKVPKWQSCFEIIVSSFSHYTIWDLYLACMTLRVWVLVL